MIDCGLCCFVLIGVLWVDISGFVLINRCMVVLIALCWAHDTLFTLLL